MQSIVVSAGIIIKNGKVLAAQRTHDDELSYKWEFPGGKQEPDESIEACLERELMEEFGVECKVSSYLGESNYQYPNKKIQLKAFIVDHVAGKFLLNVHANMKWISIDELHTLDWAPADIELVNQLIKYFESH
jgi:8-oxo-dGTP diphosphatase